MKHPAFCKILQQYVWQLFGGMQCLVVANAWLLLQQAMHNIGFQEFLCCVVTLGFVKQTVKTYCLFLMHESCSQIHL